MNKRRRNHAVRNITLVTLATFCLIVTNGFFVTIGKVHLRSGTDLSVYADSANIVTETEQALRGNIYDRSGNVIAQDSRTYNIVCILDSNRISTSDEPAYVEDKEDTAEKLSAILHIDYQKVLDYLNQDVYQTELGNGGRQLSKSTKDEIEALNLPGIEFTNSIQRIYPNGVFASNLIGYAQGDENGKTVGMMGLELYLDYYLQGEDGSRTYQADKNGYVLPGMQETVVSAVNGDNVYLTLDSSIQSTLEDSFKQTAELFNLDRAWGGVMEVYTGKVVAWGQTPSFDPNTLDDIEDYNNIGAQVPYEPGSTLKTFTWAAAINEGKYDGDALADGNEYCYTADELNNPVKTSEANSMGCIYNAGKIMRGSQTLDQGLIYSLNTVAGTIQNEWITPQIHLQYLKDFGFFSEVDTDGLPEESGYLNFNWPADKLALSYGQGSTVTMLQLFQAYSAFFSDGTMVKPYFVESIRDPYDNSNVIYQAETKVVGNPITEETARHVQEIMKKVIDANDGGGRFYRIPECDIIGKTGTTEVAGSSSEDAYDTGKTITSFMCAMPADNPQVLVYYAFEADNDSNSHVKSEPVTSLLRKVAQTYGFTSGTVSAVDESGETVGTTKTVSFEMPDLLNHTTAYAEEKLTSANNVYVLGGGSNVIAQYPSAGDTAYSSQKIFLVTDAVSFEMPDMTGWTRQEVASLWSVTGFMFKLEGEGTVSSQNIPAGTVVTKGTQIEVVFS